MPPCFLTLTSTLATAPVATPVPALRGRGRGGQARGKGRGANRPSAAAFLISSQLSQTSQSRKRNKISPEKPKMTNNQSVGPDSEWESDNLFNLK